MTKTLLRASIMYYTVDIPLLFLSFTTHLLVDELNMRSPAGFYILLASGRPLCVPIFTVVHALPCVQKALSLPSSSSPYPSGCRTTLNDGPGAAEHLNELFANTSTQQIDSAQNTYLTLTLVVTLVVFIIFASLLIVLFFFGPSIRSFIVQKMRKEEKPKLGFGFDGLSKQELKQLRLKEEEAAVKTSWFTKLPMRPPALVLKHSPSPLLPIQIEGLHRVELDNVKVEKSHVRDSGSSEDRSRSSGLFH